MDFFSRLERWLDRRSDGVREKTRARASDLSIVEPAARRPVRARSRVRALSPEPAETSSPLAFIFGDAPEPPPRPVRPAEPSEPGTAFALALYEALRHTPGNLCFSPSGIRLVLALICEGARGETGQQMRAVLRLPADGPLSLALIGGVPASLAASGVLSSATALWIHPVVSILPDYMDTLNGAVDCVIAGADFAGDPDAAAGRINGWARERTQGRVPQIVESSEFNVWTRLVLVNAVAFKDAWAEPFDVAHTRDADFHLADGRAVTVPLMSRQITTAYFEVEGLQGLRLSYQRSTLSLVVLLPRCADGVTALESELSPDTLGRWLRMARQHRVHVSLPRLSIASGPIDWTATLTALGMPLVFSEHADLSGINGQTPPDPEALRVASMAHQTRLDLTEVGTTAMAATGAVIRAFGMAQPDASPVPEFCADRPFIFAIRDDTTGTLVFLGRVVNPLE